MPSNTKAFKNAVRFRLVAAPVADQKTGRSNALQRIHRLNKPTSEKKHKEDEISERVLSILEPECFGIHNDLETETLRELCQTVYGNNTLPPGISLDKNTSNIYDERIIDQKDIDSFQDVDTYFPNDGYDYSQHLASVGKGGGAIISSSTDYGKEIENNIEASIPKECKEALDNCDEYEILDDDFIRQVAPPEELEKIEENLLWGDENIVTHPLHNPYLELLDERKNLNETINDNEQLFSTDNEDANLEKLLKEYEEDENEINNEQFIYNGLEINHNFLNTLDQLNQQDSKYTNVDETTNELTTDLECKLRTLAILQKERDSSASDSSDTSASEERWDCETILTKLSSTTNNPGFITKPAKKIINKNNNNLINKNNNIIKLDVQGIPIGTRELTKKNKQVKARLETIHEINQSIYIQQLEGLPPVKTLREKNETPEMRRERKQNAKATRKALRLIKSEKNIMRKNETKKQPTVNPYDIPLHIRHFRVD